MDAVRGRGVGAGPGLRGCVVGGFASEGCTTAEYSARMSCEFLMFTTFLGVVYGIVDAVADHVADALAGDDVVAYPQVVSDDVYDICCLWN